MYRRGLNDNAKEELMRYGDSLRTLIEASIELNDKPYELARKKRCNDPRGRTGPLTRSPSYRGGGLKTFGRRNDVYGPMPMELNSTQRSRGWTLRESGKIRRIRCAIHVAGKAISQGLSLKKHDESRTTQCYTEKRFWGLRRSREGEHRPAQRTNTFMWRLERSYSRYLMETDLSRHQHQQSRSILQSDGKMSKDRLHHTLAQTMMKMRKGNKNCLAMKKCLKGYIHQLGILEAGDKSEESESFKSDVWKAYEPVSEDREAELTDFFEDQFGKDARFEKEYPMLKREDVTLEKDHAIRSWTACYDDDCLINTSEKEGSGWYPKKLRKQKQRNGEKIRNSW